METRCGCAAGVVLTIGSWIALRRPPPAPLKATQFQIAPPKGYFLEGGGIRSSFALSPDGERIAFTAKDASGAFRLFLREFSASESVPWPMAREPIPSFGLLTARIIIYG